jgi:hypothetical protein
MVVTGIRSTAARTLQAEAHGPAVVVRVQHVHLLKEPDACQRLQAMRAGHRGAGRRLAQLAPQGDTLVAAKPVQCRCCVACTSNMQALAIQRRL